jgi:hypothetical protein
MVNIGERIAGEDLVKNRKCSMAVWAFLPVDRHTEYKFNTIVSIIWYEC